MPCASVRSFGQLPPLRLLASVELCNRVGAATVESLAAKTQLTDLVDHQDGGMGEHAQSAR